MKTYYDETEKIEKNSVLPIYYQLAKILERDIYEGKLKPGETLPPEHEIAEKYEISRMTVRRAISELITAGMVYAQKGKGTFVAKPKLDVVIFELKDFHEEIIKRGMKPNVKLLSVKIVRANQEIAKKLEVPLNTRCLYFRLLMTANDEPLIYENKYVVYTKQKPLLEQELKDPSLSNLATLHGDHFPIMSKRVLHASLVTAEETRVLGVVPNTPVFVVEQIIYDADKKPIGWGKSVCRGDRFKFTSYIGWSMNNLKVEQRGSEDDR